MVDRGSGIRSATRMSQANRFMDIWAIPLDARWSTTSRPVIEEMAASLSLVVLARVPGTPPVASRMARAISGDHVGSTRVVPV